jgi:flagellin
MGLTVNTNTASLVAQRNVSRNVSELERTIERLSSGSRINSARDDAAGLAISTRLTSQIRGISQAVRNGNDGISLSQTADAALNDIGSAVLRIRELAVQAASDTNTEDDRKALQQEVSALTAEVTRVAEETEYNGNKPIGGGSRVTFLHLGPNARESLGISPLDARSSSLGRHARGEGATIDSTKTLAFGDVKVNGYDVRGTVAADDLDSTANASGSAIAVARAFNDSAYYSRVNAQPLRTEVTGAAAVQAGTLDAVDNLTINGQMITGFNVDAGDAGGDLVDAINAVSSETGVTATVDDLRRLVLTAEDGRNVEVVTSSANAADLSGLNGGAAATVVTAGTVLLESDKAIKLVIANANGADATGYGGGAPGTLILGVDGTNAISSIDVTTRDGANRAIDVADAALRQLGTYRAGFGALTNRLESAVNNLSMRGENLTAARSRITDADFAAETAALARNAFLRDAGVSVLAQANVSGSAALNLLS